MQVFETIVQGVLVAVVLAYILSTQRRWQARLVGFADRMRMSLLSAIGADADKIKMLYLPLALGSIYFLGIIGNVVGFGVLRPAHEVIIQEVYCTVDDLTQSGAEARGGARDSSETTVMGLALITLQSVGQAVTHPITPRQGAMDREARPYYPRYIRDEMYWRNAEREAAAGCLDPLLKQSRVARGTAVAALFMMCTAAIKLVLFGCCIGVATSAKSVRAGPLRAGALWVLHWLDRRVVRKDERLVGVQGDQSLRRDPELVESEARRLVWTNVPVMFSAALIFLLALGGYKMVEREYHTTAICGARTAEIVLAGAKR